MSFRSLSAAYALLLAAPLATSAADAPQPVLIEAHPLRPADVDSRANSRVSRPDISVLYEMKGRVREDGTVELQCEDASHAALGGHAHDGGRGEEIR